MKILNLEQDGRKYRAYISTDGYGRYEYSLYEIIPKKHWWSLGKRYMSCGVIWDNIEKEISIRIAKEIKMENEINHLEEQFNKL